MCSMLSGLSPFNSAPLTALLYTALVVGTYKLAFTTLGFLAIIFDSFILPPVDLTKYGTKQGCWAVITGASDGIGKEFALQLAKKGLNIVLVSRTQSKLALLATEISTKYNVETKIVAFDASSDAAENYESIAKAIDGLPISALINNVGQSHSIPVPFLETEDKEMKDIMTVNNTVTLKVTKLVAPLIVSTIEEKKSKRGLILTMGSFAGMFPSPFLATYCASKYFLQGWSYSLAGELKSKNVDVELVMLSFVTSAMSKIKKASLMVPTPKKFVASTLKNIGRRVGAQERYATITPYPSHALMHWAVENTVGFFSKFTNRANFYLYNGLRIKALKRAQRLAAEKQE